MLDIHGKHLHRLTQLLCRRVIALAGRVNDSDPTGVGSVSALHYGTKVTALIIDTGLLAVGTTVFPYSSQITAQPDWGAIWHTLRTYSRLALAGAPLVTAVVILFSTPLVRLLCQRGAFTESDTWLVSQILMLYVLQVPFNFFSTVIVGLTSS